MMLDTSPEAAAAQAEVLRRLGPERRFLIACDMRDTVRDLARSRIAEQNQFVGQYIRDALPLPFSLFYAVSGAHR